MLYHLDLLTVVSADRRREAIELAHRSELAAALRRPPARAQQIPPQEVAIRLSRDADGPALERLATLSEKRLRDVSLVVAESDGELVAAVPLEGRGPVLADPFQPTSELVGLLQLRARQVRSATRGRTAARRGLLRRVARV